MINHVAKILMVTMLLAGAAGCKTTNVKDPQAALQELSISNIENKPYGGEDVDWNITPTREYVSDYHSSTPTTHPVADNVSTYELRRIIANSEHRLVVANVLGSRKGDSIDSIPRSIWLKGFGRAPKHFSDSDRQRFASYLTKLTNNNKDAPIVFFCLDAKCWLSYNACLRASELGYTNIYWYRGGIDAWKSAGLPLVSVGIYGE